MTSTALLRRLELDLGELLERHEQARGLHEFEQYADHPVRFIREVLHWEPWSRQVEIAESVRDNPLTVVRSANAIGKDAVAARLAMWWIYARRGLVLLTGPTERQVVEVCMGEVARAFRAAKDLPGELFRTALRLPGEQAGVLAFTSTESSKLTGFHAPRVMCLLTEAQGVEPFAWEGLLACATGPQDRVLAVGNPLAPSGRFFAVSRTGSGWHALQIGAAEHPNITEGRTVIPGGPSPAFVERMRTEYGEGSPVYQARVLGDFPDRAEEGLIRRSWCEAAVERWRAEHEQGRGEPLVSIDPARLGRDETMCAVLHGGDVVSELVGWRQVDLMETVDRVRAVADRVGVQAGEGQSVVGGGQPPQLVVDEVGLGAGLLDRLRELGYRARGYNGGAAAREPDKWLNLRSQSYWELRERLEAGTLALPPDEALMDELVALQWRPTPEGKIRMEAKDELRGRIGRSPDRADAVVMAVWAARGQAVQLSSDVLEGWASVLMDLRQPAFEYRLDRWPR